MKQATATVSANYDSWWTIHGQALLDALRRAHDGDDPEIVYAELYANTDHEGVPR